MCRTISVHPLFLCQYLAEKEKAKSNFFAFSYKKSLNCSFRLSINS